jgi:hypothetical protein
MTDDNKSVNSKAILVLVWFAICAVVIIFHPEIGIALLLGSVFIWLLVGR